MYFIWRSNAALANRYLYVSNVAVGLKPRLWETGEALLKPPATFTLIGDGDSPSTLSDMILTQFELPVLSPKAMSVLEEIGVDNVEYFPIEISAPKPGGLEKSYKIANILGLISCLDKKHAKIQTFPEDKTAISWLERYRILDDKIKPVGKSKKPPLLFRLGEFPSHVLAHESVKQAFEKHGLTGAEFIPPEKFA